MASGLESRQGASPRGFDSPALRHIRDADFAVVAELMSYHPESPMLLAMFQFQWGCPGCSYRNFEHRLGPLIPRGEQSRCGGCRARVNIIGVTTESLSVLKKYGGPQFNWAAVPVNLG